MPLIRIILGLLLCSSQLLAQSPPSGDGPPQGGDNPNNPLDVVVDTSIYYYLFPGDPGKYYPIQDTMLGDYFSQYDPIRGPGRDMFNLGNLGTPHRNLYYEAPDFRGVTLGIDHYDAYRLSPNSMRFYRVQQAYSRMDFSQGSDQEETLFGAEFGRNFEDGISASINFRRHNNQGHYNHQRAIDSRFGIGLWYQSPKGRYESFFTYTSSSETIQENGGITNELRDENGLLVDGVAVPIRTSDLMARYDQSHFSYHQYFSLFPTRDSTGKIKPTAFGLAHNIQYISQGLKMYDESISESEIDNLYGPLVTDSRGLRNFARINTIRNAVDIFLIRRRPADDPEAPPVRKSFLKAGILYDLHTVNQEPLKDNLNNLFLRGTLDLTPGPGFQAKAYAHLGFLSNIGDFRLQGTIATGLKEWFVLEGEAMLQQRSPTLTEERLFISQQAVWDESSNFKKHTETRFAGGLFLPKTNTRASVAWNLTDGYIYYDSLSFPKQLDNALNVLQFQVDQHVKVWKLHLDNQVILQTGVNNELRLPGFYSKHSFYFQGFLFREAMFSRIGTDLRLIGPHTSLSYHPLTGKFIIKDGQELDWQPLLDAFVTFKVEKFRFFFRFENILAGLNQSYYYLIDEYPIRPFGIRFGLSWQFVE
ncbi:MAG: putative porin [Bacteroidetes bacterium]|nr:putative porin [Bacteroidota bacterium]